MEDEKIIPTRYKSRIPHTHSYPVGAKDISDALRGVPQYSELSVHFSFWNRLARNHGTATPYYVIDVLYSGPTRAFSGSRTIEEQSGDPRWLVTVHAVPRSLRRAIHAKVLAEALPAIRSWLVANLHSTNREGRHGVTFSLDELKNELIVEETASPLWQTEKTNR